MEDFTFLPGDNRASLKTLKAGSVQCCITSPPYYGLRDYGTAEWVGGNDPTCQHKIYKNAETLARHMKTVRLKNVDEIMCSQQAGWRDYCRHCGAKRVDKQIGLERTPEAYVAELVTVFREVRRVLRNDGTLWINIGDSYASGTTGRDDYAFYGGEKPLIKEPFQKREAAEGQKAKDLTCAPWLLGLALRADGWHLRQDIIWHKPSPIPEPVKDRCTKSHEYILLLSKSPKYYYDADAIAEFAKTPAAPRNTSDGKYGPARLGGSDKINKRSVWTIPGSHLGESHYAAFPIRLPELCLLAGTKRGDVVLDPFSGAGTTALACLRRGRRYVGCELRPEYIEIAKRRLRNWGKTKRELAPVPALGWQPLFANTNSV